MPIAEKSRARGVGDAKKKKKKKMKKMKKMRVMSIMKKKTKIRSSVRQ